MARDGVEQGIEGTIAEKARLLPAAHVEYFRDLIDGVRPLCRWGEWWDANAADVERAVGRTFFLRLKLYPIETLRAVVAACGVARASPPPLAPIGEDEYAVQSAAVEYFTRNEPASAVLALDAHTSGLDFARGVVRRVAAVGGDGAVDAATLDAFYLANFRSYGVAPRLAVRHAYRLVAGVGGAGEVAADPGGWRGGLSRVAFDPGGRRALVVWHERFPRSTCDYACVVEAEASAGATPTWRVSAYEAVDGMSWH